MYLSNLNSLTAVGPYFSHRFFGALFKVDNFLNFCLLTMFDSLNSLTAIRFWQEQKLLPRRIPTVGIARKVSSTTNTMIPKYHHHGRAVPPSYGMRLMDLPNPTQVTSSKGVGQGRLGWVQY
jgi:hypothetical protein